MITAAWVLVFVHIGGMISPVVTVQPIYFQTKEACDAAALEFNNGLPQPKRGDPERRFHGRSLLPYRSLESVMGPITMSKQPLAERLEAFARDADKLDGFARDHVLKTLGGCVKRNLGEITAALRERESRLDQVANGEGAS